MLNILHTHLLNHIVTGCYRWPHALFNRTTLFGTTIADWSIQVDLIIPVAYVPIRQVSLYIHSVLLATALSGDPLLHTSVSNCKQMEHISFVSPSYFNS